MVKLMSVDKTRLTGRRGRPRSVKLGGGGRVLVSLARRQLWFVVGSAEIRNLGRSRYMAASMLGASPALFELVPSLSAFILPCQPAARQQEQRHLMVLEAAQGYSSPGGAL
jgi:hypothetical protein